MKKLLIAALIPIALYFIFAMPNDDNKLPSDCTRVYVFKEYNGCVACFEQGSGEPFLVTKTKIRDLPPVDRVMLRTGVEVRGARAMSRALEDYCS